MATQTEPLTIGDVVKMEVDPLFTRDEKTVAASQTLVVGQVVNLDSSSQIVSASGTADEVQTIGITGSLSGGTFTLTFVDLNGATKETDPIAYGASTANVQTGVDTALGSNKVTVAGTAITAMTFTFDGTGYAELPQELIRVDGSALTAVEDITVTRTTEGSEQLIDGICLEGFTTESGETPKKSILVRGPAIVDEANLTYGTTPIANVRAALLVLGIVTRTSA